MAATCAFITSLKTICFVRIFFFLVLLLILGSFLTYFHKSPVLQSYVFNSQENSLNHKVSLVFQIPYFWFLIRTEPLWELCEPLNHSTSSFLFRFAIMKKYGLYLGLLKKIITIVWNLMDYRICSDSLRLVISFKKLVTFITRPYNHLTIYN